MAVINEGMATEKVFAVNGMKPQQKEEEWPSNTQFKHLLIIFAILVHFKPEVPCHGRVEQTGGTKHPQVIEQNLPINASQPVDHPFTSPCQMETRSIMLKRGHQGEKQTYNNPDSQRRDLNCYRSCSSSKLGLSLYRRISR